MSGRISGLASVGRTVVHVGLDAAVTVPYGDDVEPVRQRRCVAAKHRSAQPRSRRVLHRESGKAISGRSDEIFTAPDPGELLQ